MKEQSFHTKDNQTIKLRTGEAKDGFQMHRLTRDILNEQNGLIMTLQDFSMTVEDQKRKNEGFYYFPSALTMIAEHGQKIVGILTLEPELMVKTSHRGTIGIIVHKDYRSNGVGKSMMKAMLDWNMQFTIFEKIELEVLESNKRAISLYEKLGFKTEGITANAVKHSQGKYENLLKMGLMAGN